MTSTYGFHSSEKPDIRQERKEKLKMTSIVHVWTLALLSAGFVILCVAAHAEEPYSPPDLSFKSGTFDGWTLEEPETWTIGINPELYTQPDDPPRYVVSSRDRGEERTGILRSNPFTIKTDVQRFSIAGWDGTTTGMNDGDRNYVLLRSYPDGEILRRTHTPGQNRLMESKWHTAGLIGRKVFLEVVDANPVIRPGGFAWIAFADYRQEEIPMERPIERNDLYGVRIDSGAEQVVCRTLPFLAAHPGKRGDTRRWMEGESEIIAIGASAEVVCLLGMINEGWDYGQAHWGSHPELLKTRRDQVYIGSKIGDLEIRYASGATDTVPIVIGATAWFVSQWAYGPTHSVGRPIREPFASRPEYAEVLAASLKIRENPEPANDDNRHTHYFLSIRPRLEKIESIVIHNNEELYGRPLVSAITLAGANPSEDMQSFGTWRIDAADLEPAVDAARPGDWSRELLALSRVLYTREEDLPDQVELIDFPEGLDAALIRFLGGVEADMLSNLWVANLAQMDQKFESDTGYFRETGQDCPWYGGYMGIGTWAGIGVYSEGAYSRTSDHYVSLALRCINDPARTTNYVDFCDKWLYYYRSNRDPDKGPPNPELDVDKYPKDAPPHWAFVLNGPFSLPYPLNEIPGNEEMCGHGATIVGRWVSWRLIGAPRDEWLTAPRADVYGKSRWDSTKDAADFICWLMDYTGMDVIWSEGESTGWGGGPHLPLATPNMHLETDPEKIRRNYANADMYEPYPTYVCLVALRCSAQIAEAVGDLESTARWREYADRLVTGMIQQLRVGDHTNFMWRVSPFSVFPSLQDSLVQAWFSIYYDGLDPNRLHADMTQISRNTLVRQLNQEYGYAPVLGMGYGQGWLTKSALILDDMDSSGPLLWNIAKYSYDKNMDYVDESRDIDWRKWMWLIPEGANILPDGSWYRIGDLSNGANQGPAMHALALCAGVDDTNPRDLKILPRAPEPLTGIEISNFFALVPDGDGLRKARLEYRFIRPGVFSLKSDVTLPTLSVRLGPFDEASARRAAEIGKYPPDSSVRVDRSGKFRKSDAWWVWIDGMGGVSSVEIDLR